LGIDASNREAELFRLRTQASTLFVKKFHLRDIIEGRHRAVVEFSAAQSCIAAISVRDGKKQKGGTKAAFLSSSSNPREKHSCSAENLPPRFAQP